MKSRFNLKPADGVLEFSLMWDGKNDPIYRIINCAISTPEYRGDTPAAFLLAVAEFLTNEAEKRNNNFSLDIK